MVDTTPPGRPALLGLPSGEERSTTASASFSGESAGRFECRLNGAPWSTCQSPLALDGLAQGAQLLEVRQVDAAGNLSEVAVATWTVDTVAPRLAGAIRARRKGGMVTITSSFVSTLGRPSKLEYATSRPQPSPAAPPNSSRTVNWSPAVKVRSSQTIAWIRISDAAGNQSPWSRVR